MITDLETPASGRKSRIGKAVNAVPWALSKSRSSDGSLGACFHKACTDGGLGVEAAEMVLEGRWKCRQPGAAGVAQLLPGWH